MKKFEIRVLEYGTMKLVSKFSIEATNVDEARSIGITRHINSTNVNKHWVGAQNI